MTDKEREKFVLVWKPAYDAFIALYPFTTESLDGEIWLPIPNYEELYHGSNFGRVKSFHNGKVKIKKPLLNSQGYLRVDLWKNNSVKPFYVHRLVGKLFIPNPENKPEVDHRFGMKFDCYVENLRWATRDENINYSFENGLHKSGEEHHNAKLTDEQIIYIRQNPDGLNTVQLAEIFGVNPTTISDIQRGKKYKNAGGVIREKFVQPVNRTPDDKREEIRARYNAGGISTRALAKELGYGQTTIRRIIHELD